MELRTLRTFVAVAEELHFGRAAARLHLAQSAVSQQVAQLERDVGVALLARTSRRVELSRAGEAFLVEARRTLDAAGSARRAARRAAAGETGWLRIGFVDSAAYDLLPRLLAAFHQRRPEVRLELQELSTEAQLEGVGDDVDVSITRDTDPLNGVELTPLVDEPLLAAVDDGHPLAEREAVDLAELAAEPFVLFPREHVPMVYDHLVAVCRLAGFRPREGAQALQYATMLGLVTAGYGVAVVPAAVRVVGSAHVRYLPLRDPQATSRLAIAVPVGRADQLATVFRDLARDLAPSIDALLDPLRGTRETPG
ncbi:LysR family transcriptional regulator [Egibacter rhizosphaerae]|uniref:LysR family transcriptional regulator n=1 Tax=Egibacter rhizosphaerae TaxID=1670831 RepID=A0A411YEY1_9ACTN|nr:LysR family transcriptional regulator [Egibacter rhizosphaerae]QBI19770.1 LysR family transcriptional regulator [Egibacter rhizosphaerae]